jgi:hypothetical protein
MALQLIAEAALEKLFISITNSALHVYVLARGKGAPGW